MSARPLRWLCACLLVFAASAHAADAVALDAFGDPGAWSAVASDQVTTTLREDSSAGKAALCLDFDFHGVSGYAAMRRALPISYPANYAFSFQVRGKAPANSLQFKLVDASGDNVWWVNREAFAFPPAWSTLRYKKREIRFAWGPATDRSLHESASIEFTIQAGHGGSGEVCFSDLQLHELPVPPAHWPAPRVRATSTLRGSAPQQAIDGDTATAWRSDPRRGRTQTLTLDFGAAREFGGLILHWRGQAYASRYDVEVSDDAHEWRRVRHVERGNGGVDPLYLPESESRYLRLRMLDGPSSGYALAGVEIEDLAFGASANAFFSALAKQVPRGFYPRAFHDEQTYWTVVGIDGGHASGLLSEDGALEVARGGFSIEPFLIEAPAAGASGNTHAAAVTTWADVTITHALADEYLPMPRVTWREDGLDLEIAAFAAGRPGRSQLLARYTLTNRSAHARTITLALALRPFQVNPAVQFLNTPGGVSPIHDLGWDGRVIAVDGQPRVVALDRAAAFIASPFDSGMVVEHLAEVASRVGGAAHFEQPRVTRDPNGLASGALLYRIELAAGAQRVRRSGDPARGQRDAAAARAGCVDGCAGARGRRAMARAARPRHAARARRRAARSPIRCAAPSHTS